MFKRGDHLLCVDCNLKVEQAFQIRDNALKQQMNYLLEQADFLTGLHGVTPRYKITQPVVHQGPMSFHTINVDRSVVGAINTGTVRRMEVALNNIYAKNHDEGLEKALKDFAESVLSTASLTAQAKNDVVDQLSVLASQLAVPKESRVIIVMKALVTSIAANIASTALVQHWDKIARMIGF
jgi:hypothetical protein